MVDRSVAPHFFKDFSFQLPKPEVFSLANGIDLIFFPDIQQEVIKLEVVYAGGKWHEPKNGVSHFTTAFLDKGTKNKSAQEIAEFFDYYGAHIEITSGYDFSSASLYAMRKDFSKVFQVFRDILTAPSFPENELELNKELFLQELKINKQKNSFVASRLIRKNLFGETHPYGKSIDEIDVQSITRENIDSFYSSYFSPIAVYIIGNINATERKEAIDFFSTLPNTSANEKTYAINSSESDFHQPMPDSIQTTIRLGSITLNRSHTDYPALLLLNHILGGYFGSRLMKNIREEKGLTYGINSTIHHFKNSCILVIGTDVKSSSLKKTIEEIKKEIDKLTNELISEKELSLSKNHFIGSLQLEISNPFSAVEKIKSIRLNGLDSNFYKNIIDGTYALSAKELQHCAQKHLNNFLTISVG